MPRTLIEECLFIFFHFGILAIVVDKSLVYFQA